MAEDQERRSDSRRNLNLQVEYPDRQGYQIDTTESVSPGGILVRSSQHHRVGEEVKLAISLPGFPSTLHLTGVVARIREATATEPRGVALRIAEDEYQHGLGAVLSPAESREFSLSSGPYSVLAALPRVRLATTPTPLHRAERLSKALNGPDIWFKRDDLTGFAHGGNTVRKMELVAAEALQSGADTLVTGAPVRRASRIRVMAATAARLGLKAYALSEEAAPESRNELGFCELLGIDIRELIDPEASIDSNIDLLVTKLKEKGHKPYAINEHDTSWLGACGYMLASIEILAQLRRLQVEADMLVCPVGSAETMAGLVVAQRWLDCSYDVLGISVAHDEQWCSARVATVAYEASSRLNIDDTIPVDDIWTNADYVGDGYGKSSPESIEAVRTVARLEGIFLDPLVSGKAMAGLIDLIDKGEFRKGQSVVFLHTGGSP
jgi:L-cysteate sulfo-lyase